MRFLTFEANVTPMAPTIPSDKILIVRDRSLFLIGVALTCGVSSASATLPLAYPGVPHVVALSLFWGGLATAVSALAAGLWLFSLWLATRFSTRRRTFHGHGFHGHGFRF